MKPASKNYTPIYFLASLGCGGLSVSFFMYLMFMVEHKGLPMPTFDLLYPQLTGGAVPIQAMIVVALAGIIFFAILHYRYLTWNIVQYRAFCKTPEAAAMRSSHKAVSFMAVPLTYSMSVNVAFVLGAVFVPKLWTIIEYLLPFAMIAFLLIGIYALKLFLGYFTDFIIQGNYDYAQNNNLSQLLGIFAFAMVSVGLAAPTAMSHLKLTAGLGFLFSTFFFVVALGLAFIKIVLGMSSIFQNGIDKESSASLWIGIPIITLMGISAVRLMHGLDHNFDTSSTHTSYLILTGAFLSLQLMFGLVGYKAMKRLNYFDEYVSGTVISPGSLALICPGVALFVFGQFFLHHGLVSNGILTQFSVVYFLLQIPLVYLQYVTIKTMFRLNKKLFLKS
ncbi:hypothetical protein SAMN05660420_01278 [Desulfuromusa kysingii]|uniref:Voltage-dependent anion channel n=1 Tax=Desulfuromusa kysingii TaxID=37625 RepID=A0A1H3YLD3_9BACT|nr:hypothetical protein [Desulfuromusa kysingii]SEA12011.1 hypothetical protein SAMN05660420_01278 [Desulfuromusa kysingii]